MAEQLRAGVMQVDITPPVGVTMSGYGSRDRPSEAILEPLSAIAVALEQGGVRCALVTGDLIGVSRAVADSVRERVAGLTGLPPEAVLVCATHTHWGPALEPTDYIPTQLNASIFPEYTRDLSLRMAGAVAQAWNTREPVIALAGTGEADQVSFNRRPVGPDGRVVMSLTMDSAKAELASAEGARLARTWVRGGAPGRRLSDPLPALGQIRAGVCDPALPVLKLVRMDGSPLAALMAFGCHPVCGADMDTFYMNSPDWPGYARRVFERVLGCPAIVMAGACGDQVPRVRRGDARRRIGESIGAEALRVWHLLDGEGIGPLRIGSRTVQIPVRELPSVAEAQAALDAKPDPHGTGAVMEREILSLARRYENRSTMTCELWAMRLGTQWGLVGLPGEILVEIGLQIRQHSPFEHTAVVELALDAPGYFPTDAARIEGGYEPTWSPAGPGAEAALVQGATALLREIAG